MQTDNAIYTKKEANYALSILHDNDAQNPLDYLDFGTMYLFHRGYSIGHAHGYSTPSDFFEHFDSNRSTIDDEPVLFLPVYMYDHSGLSLSTIPFSCPWDSGQVGVIAVNVSKAKEQFGDDYKDKAFEVLRSEVREYSHFLSGECYGFIIEDSCGNTVDSCFGLLGYDNAKREAEEALKHACK